MSQPQSDGSAEPETSICMGCGQLYLLRVLNEDGDYLYCDSCLELVKDEEEDSDADWDPEY